VISVVIFFTTEGTERHRDFSTYFSVYLCVLCGYIFHHGGHGEAQRLILSSNQNLFCCFIQKFCFYLNNDIETPYFRKASELLYLKTKNFSKN
jgi:hypothetical protein